MNMFKKVFSRSNVISFTLGVVISLIIAGYFGYQYAVKTNAKYASYSEEVKWVIANPDYAKMLKQNHDTYMKAAEDAFIKTFNQEEASK